ncbi:MAG TPA: trigger factor [Candidatus Polarisedimenticolaceae bacterium]|nr:trigger factor [Candidatus Polarisedimenticolaceae bacterium]
MKAEVTKRTDTHVSFTIVADTDELLHAKKHSYDKYRDQVKVAGFRPGKAPDNIVAREIGDATIQHEALEHAIGHSYSAAVTQEKVAVIAPPDVQVKKFVPYTELEYEATVEVVPPIKLPDYKKVKKSLKKVSVKDQRIDEMVEDLRRRVAKRIPAVRSAEMGDEIKFDFDGTKDGQPVPGSSGKNYTLKLGSGNFIPGFEEEMVGLKVGDNKTFTITFPKDYHEKSLAGQAVEFAVKMHEVTELNLPDITDAFASEVGPFKTVEELRADIKKQLILEAEQAAKREYENELLDELIAKTKMTLPERLVAQQLERLKAEIGQRLASSGLTMEHYLSAQKQTPEQLEQQMRPEAEKRVKLAMMLSEVARQENLAVGADEIDHEIEGLRLQYTDAAMQKELAGDQVREDVYNHLMAGKVIHALTNYAQS